MFDNRDPEARGGGGAAGLEYGHVWPLPPGAVDPVRLAELVDAIDAGALVLDPVQEALCGPEPGLDAAALFAALDSANDTARSADCADAEQGWPSAAMDGPGPAAAEVVDPRVLVPQHMPSVEDMAPGPELAKLLDDARLGELGAYELVEAIAGWQRMASWAAARQAEAIMELSRRAEMQPVTSGREIESMSPLRVTAGEVAARLALTSAQGEALVARARVWCAACRPPAPRWNRVASMCERQR
jgi:hypothetical protein